MPFEDYKERRAAEIRARLARKAGRVTENRSAIRPRDDIEPNHRANGLHYDQSGKAIWGMIAWPFRW